jgi:hypothetical protein
VIQETPLHADEERPLQTFAGDQQYSDQRTWESTPKHSNNQKRRSLTRESNSDDCGRMTDRTTMSNPGNFLVFIELIKRNRSRPLNPQQLPLHIAPESALRDDEYWPSRLFSILSLLSTFR